METTFKQSREDQARASSYLTLLGLLVLGSACRDNDEERPPIVWTGEHVQVGTDLDLDAWCPGTLPRLDSYVGTLKTLFEVPDDHVVTYYLYPSPVTDYACQGRYLACFTQGAVFTSDLLDTHELVHAVSAVYRAIPHFFEEGAASYWGHAFPADFRGLDIRDVLDEYWSSGLPNSGYALAGHFMSYLVHTYGMERYLALLRTSNRQQSREDFEQAFEKTMGNTLDDAIDDYEAQWPYCDVTATARSLHDCEQPAIKLPPGEWMNFDLDISCVDPEVVGPSTPGGSGDGPRIWRDLTVDVETETQNIKFDIPELGEPNTVIMDIKRCDTRCGDVMLNRWRLTPNHVIGNPNEFLIKLKAGRYVVRVSRAVDDPGPVHFGWRPQAF
ncbi:MAG: hypothetical protein KA385_12620 [Vicinamibacteria bacterium]|nr:hypothetical protein [Vicinamibacteria bacterium]